MEEAVCLKVVAIEAAGSAQVLTAKISAWMSVVILEAIAFDPDFVDVDSFHIPIVILKVIICVSRFKDEYSALVLCSIVEIVSSTHVLISRDSFWVHDMSASGPACIQVITAGNLAMVHEVITSNTDCVEVITDGDTLCFHGAIVGNTTSFQSSSDVGVA